MTQNNLMQREDGTWAVVVSGVVVTDGTATVVTAELGLLNKEQAIREALRKGYKPLYVWSKEILAAIKGGGLISPTIKPL